MAAVPQKFHLPRRPDGGFTPIVRETLRALLAFGVYLVFQAVVAPWGTGKVYWRMVMAGVRPVVDWSRHFTQLPDSGTSLPQNQHTHLALILALFLVSWSIPAARRLRLFGLLAGAALLQDFAVAGVSLRLHQAQSVFQQMGWVDLLPWEYNTLELLWYLLYGVFLEFVPFLLVLLTALWNSGTGPAEFISSSSGVFVPARARAAPSVAASPPRWRRLAPWVAPLLAMSLCLVGLVLWGAVRDRDPLHQRTHRLLGRFHLGERNPALAESEYRLALREGSVDAEAWVGLAESLARAGRRGESVEVLREAALVVPDAAGQERIGAALEALGIADPGRLPTIEAIPPSSSP